MLSVLEDYYEEELDWNLHKLLPAEQRIEKVSAYPVAKPRLIGDIGLRAFFQLRKKALELVQTERIKFVYIPIPSFYVSLIGPYLHSKTGIKYGIDYIDPWVHVFPGSDQLFSRHWFSTWIAKLLEPKAVKNASLITGVAEGYYKGVIERNPHLKQSCVFGAMPYGGEAADHAGLQQLNLQPYLFNANTKLQFVYAGAMLPKAYALLEEIFKAIAATREMFAEVEFHFIGTGKTANDQQSYNIKPLAERYGLWQSVVFEYPKRIPYLDVLIHLEAGDAVFIFGSTEPHYTPSKTYQGVLSKKPLLAVLHSASTAVQVIKESGAGVVLAFNGEEGLEDVQRNFVSVFTQFKGFQQSFDAAAIDHTVFELYSARSVTAELARLLDEVYTG